MPEVMRQAPGVRAIVGELIAGRHDVVGVDALETVGLLQRRFAAPSVGTKL